ncbi:HEPN domain-containing protein [Ruminococcus sp. OM06-36AC]|uniref:HEPN domain-containing protein n=1 Tax=Ruminococcus TaxID=1263 RepID=UPI00164D4E1C|nr:HEPN domain-containing protein [Ruminococcus sp. OM06-36AC]
MRERYDDKGNLIGCCRMVFDEIPDDYQIQKVILEDMVYDLSYLGVMKHLRDNNVAQEFSDNNFYSLEVLSHMALDYLNSAMYLHKGIIADRGQDLVSYYVIPCAFLCKHSIELKIKECLLSMGEKELKGHSVLTLWDKLNKEGLPQYDKLRAFIVEVEKIDNNEMALRYGISKGLEPLQEKFKFDVDNLISNTMFLFNILEEYVQR